MLHEYLWKRLFDKANKHEASGIQKINYGLGGEKGLTAGVKEA